MSRLKIAYLCDISPEQAAPYSGGNARIFNALSARADVTILPQSWGLAEPVRRAIYALPDAAQLRLRWRAHLLFARLIAAPVNRMLHSGEFDVAFCAYSFQSLAHVSSPPGGLLAFTSDATPTVYKRSEIGQAFGSSWISRRLLDPLTLRAERRIMSALDLMLCPSDWLKTEAEGIYALPPGIAHTVPWGANISCPGFATPPKAPSSSARLNLLLIGRDWFAKGGPLAFETLQTLRARGHDTCLTVIGCIPPESHRNAHVNVLGPLDKTVPAEAARFTDAMRSAHFLIQPSFESYGFAFCEAAAYGLPSLCLNVGGIPVRDGITGHALAATATPSDFADKIMDYVTNSENYSALRQRARTAFETELNWDAWADAAIGLMTEKLKRT